MICEAIAQHDAEKAKRCMIEHLSRVKVDEEAIRSAYPQYIRQGTRA